MLITFIVGTAGSGKSLLTSTFSNWLRMSKQNVAIINLDPGVTSLPYSPDSDVRDFINIANLMEEQKLGPNGALILAADLIAEKTEKLNAEIEELKADLVLVDTPGQMELFAFRASGPYIARELTGDAKTIVYLFDSIFSLNPLNFASNLFLSAAVYNRFLLPQIHTLSKSDLLPNEEVERIIEWSSDSENLELAIDEQLKGTERLLSLDITRSIHALDLNFPLIPTSAKTHTGWIDMNMALERILLSGEQFTH